MLRRFNSNTAAIVTVRATAAVVARRGTFAAAQKQRDGMARLLDDLPPRFMAWPEFEAVCAAHNISDARAAAAAFAQCGAVVTSADGVHGHAAQAIRDACTTALKHPWEPVVEMQLKSVTLKKRLAELKPAYEAQVAAAAASRRRTWSGFFAFTGIQLAVFSRLTYFDLDWDTMEPCSYFLGSGVGVAAFAYTLLRGIDWTNRGVDRNFVQKKYLEHADVVKYYECLEELEKIEGDIKNKVTWIATGTVPKEH